MLDPKFEVQRIAPTENGGREHASVRRILDTSPHVGKVVVEKFVVGGMQRLGTAHIGNGPSVAHVIVMPDGLTRSGSPGYTPAITVIPENY